MLKNMPTLIGIRKTIFNMVRPQFNTQERNFIAFGYHNLRARAYEVIRASEKKTPKNRLTETCGPQNKN